MRGLANHLRYVCLLQQGARPRDEWAFAPEEVARLQAQANQLSDAQVVRGLDLLADAQVRIRHGGADPRLQLELVAARLSRPALDASAQALAARVEALEAAAPPPAPPAAPAPRPRPGAGAGPRLRPTSRTRRRPPPRSPRPGARAAAAPPTAAREAARPDLEHFARLWSQILDVLEREAPPTRGFLDGSRPTRVDESSLEVTVTSAMRARCWGPATTGSACAPP